jgi:hypothetical protein
VRKALGLAALPWLLASVLALPTASARASGLACPSVSQCTAVVRAGHGVTTFDPLAPGTAAPTSIDDSTLWALACPSVALCTGVDNVGQEVTFDPLAPGTPTPTAIDASNRLLALACPSVSQCTVVDNLGQEVTFNPLAPGTPTPTATPIDGSGFPSLACPSVSQCTGVEAGEKAGQEVTFDPTTPGNWTPATVDPPVVLEIWNAFTLRTEKFDSRIVGLACPSVSRCTAVDSASREVTFDPAAPGTPTPILVDKPPQFCGEHCPEGYVTGVACPSVSRCTAVDAHDQAVTFDPSAPGNTISMSLVAPLSFLELGSIGAVACPSVSQCTATTAMWEVTFDPAVPGSATRVAIDGGQYVAPPGVGAPPPAIATPPPAMATPQITRVGQSHSRWREGTTLARFSRTRSRADAAHTRRPPVGTTFSFSLNEQATVTFRYTRALRGRKVGHGCVAQTNANRHRPSCTRTITEDSISFIGHSGMNHVAFQGRISRFKKLGLGSHTLIITATNAAGQRSQPKSLSFTIVR